MGEAKRRKLAQAKKIEHAAADEEVLPRVKSR